jgi:hypothetical protein
MERNCGKCFWGTSWEGDDGVFHICERLCSSFEDAMYDCKKPGPCEYYITPKEVDKIVDLWNAILN